MSNWQETLELVHKDGVSWMDAPRPFYLHRCRAQSEGWLGLHLQVVRCACGAIAMPDRPWDKPKWMERNSRRD